MDTHQKSSQVVEEFLPRQGGGGMRARPSTELQPATSLRRKIAGAEPLH
jgi:hypothetical protein